MTLQRILCQNVGFITNPFSAALKAVGLEKQGDFFFFLFSSFFFFFTAPGYECKNNRSHVLDVPLLFSRTYFPSLIRHFLCVSVCVND